MKKILRKDVYNENRRKKRRVNLDCEDFFIDEDAIPCPTTKEIAEALIELKESEHGILRLAATMANVGLYHAPRFLEDDTHFRLRTSGIRRYLESDPMLNGSYHTLMRYARLGNLLAEYCRTQGFVNLLWGLEEQCPEAAKDLCQEDGYESVRRTFAEFQDLSFKAMYEKLSKIVEERRREALRQQLAQAEKNAEMHSNLRRFLGVRVK